jgi:Protein of unknown function (DUF3618)
MTDATDRSAEDIERELKRIRSEIDRTASAIQDRLTPEAVVDHALAYLRGPGGRRILEAVQRNPLPAVLAAVAIGWLLLGVRRTAEDRGPGQPQRARPQEPPPSPVPGMSETPSGATTPSASPAPGAAASDAPPL